MNERARKDKGFDSLFDKSTLENHIFIGKTARDKKKILGAHKKEGFYNLIENEKNEDGRSIFENMGEDNITWYGINGISLQKYKSIYSFVIETKTLYDTNLKDKDYIEYGLQAASNYWLINKSVPNEWLSYDDKGRIWEGKGSENSLTTFYPAFSGVPLSFKKKYDNEKEYNPTYFEYS